MAISLSGGGYRAASFHLGALSYLDHVPHEGVSLLQRIKIISTISGGTFTGVAYVLSLARQQEFKACFQHLYGLLQEDKLVVEALAKINHTGQWQYPTKNKNLINAFSEIYQAKFCNGAQMSLPLTAPLGHLDEFCFNATDMHNTLPFRFQKTGLIGNGHNNIDVSAAAEIRMGDIMVASSCFPGGFEPMAFPQDFIAEEGSPLQQYWKSQGYPDNIPLMDGGILDNQGIESVELANRRRPDDQKINTYIISDVTSRESPPFEFPAKPRPGLFGDFTYRTIAWILAALVILGAAGTWYWWNASRLLLIVSVLATVFSGISLVSLLLIHRFVDNMIAKTVGQNNETPTILEDLDILEKTPIHILKNLASIRLFALSDILQNTFMRRIRTLEISGLYHDPDWTHKLVSNNIYSLTTNWDLDKNLPAPSEQMLKTAALAETMATTLWFSTKDKEKGMLDALIAAGQINLCFQLLLHLDQELGLPEVQATFTPETRQSLQQLREALLADYNKFREDDRWLLNQLKQGQPAA